MSDEPDKPDSAEPEAIDHRRLERHITALTATVDQLAAEQGRMLEGLAALAFALGLLAGLVGLQHQQIKTLTRALAS